MSCRQCGTALVAEARRWLGTPYRHQASPCAAVGCDCLGLIRGVWLAVIGETPSPAAGLYPRLGRGGARHEYVAGSRRAPHAGGKRPMRHRPAILVVFRWRDGARREASRYLEQPGTASSMPVRPARRGRNRRSPASGGRRIAAVFRFRHRTAHSDRATDHGDPAAAGRGRAARRRFRRPTGAAIGTAAGALPARCDRPAADQSTRTGRWPSRASTGARPLTAEEGSSMARVYGRARISGHGDMGNALQGDGTRTEQSSGRQGRRPKTGSRPIQLLCQSRRRPVRGPGDGDPPRLGRRRELDLTAIALRIYPGDGTQHARSADRGEAGRGLRRPFAARPMSSSNDCRWSDFGNRMPQLQVEVIRPVGELEQDVRAVCVIPGSTEHGYAPGLVSGNAAHRREPRSVNRHSTRAGIGLGGLHRRTAGALPGARKRCRWSSPGSAPTCGPANCGLPAGSNTSAGGESQNWSVDGIWRAARRAVVSLIGGKPAYGGTPADEASSRRSPT